MSVREQFQKSHDINHSNGVYQNHHNTFFRQYRNFLDKQVQGVISAEFKYAQSGGAPFARIGFTIIDDKIHISPESKSPEGFKFVPFGMGIPYHHNSELYIYKDAYRKDESLQKGLIGLVMHYSGTIAEDEKLPITEFLGYVRAGNEGCYVDKFKSDFGDFDFIENLELSTPEITVYQRPFRRSFFK